MNPSDIALLQRAAMAADYVYRTDLSYDDGLVIDEGVLWNPLVDGNHAIALAAEVQIFTLHHTRFHQIYMNLLEEGFEPANALQRAIVEMAAEIHARTLRWIK